MKMNDNLLNRLKKHLPQDLYLETVQRFTQIDEQNQRITKQINFLKNRMQQIHGYTAQIDEISQRIKDQSLEANSTLNQMEYQIKGGEKD